MGQYPPLAHIESDGQQLVDVITRYPLATFILAAGDQPQATPLPLVLNDAENELIGHLDANNPAAELLRDGAAALVIFHGPSSYISPLDYTTRQLPTYNYQQVHVRGRIRVVTDPNLAAEDLRQLVRAMEGHGGWVLTEGDARVVPLLGEIVAFRLEIAEMTGRFKLGQDKRPEDRDAVHAKLERSAGCPVARAPSSK